MAYWCLALVLFLKLICLHEIRGESSHVQLLSPVVFLTLGPVLNVLVHPQTILGQALTHKWHNISKLYLVLNIDMLFWNLYTNDNDKSSRLFADRLPGGSRIDSEVRLYYASPLQDLGEPPDEAKAAGLEDHLCMPAH